MSVLDETLDNVKAHVISLYIKNQYPALVYHNLFHTYEVVEHTQEILSIYSISAEDSFATTVAAWFHDAGHLFSGMKGHEELSWKIAESYLRPLHVDTNILGKIRACIMATKIPSHPQKLIEQIIADADTYHLGTTMFSTTDPLIRKETQIREGIDGNDWDLKTLEFLRKHRFHTEYCRAKLDLQKAKNIEMLEGRINRKPV